MHFLGTLTHPRTCVATPSYLPTDASSMSNPESGGSPMPDELGINDAAKALAAVREMIGAHSVVAFFDTSTGRVAILAEQDWVGIEARGHLFEVET